MNAEIKWLDNPEVFRVNQLEAHSDHTYYENYQEVETRKTGLLQSLNGIWKFCYSKNAKERPAKFYQENYDYQGFDDIEVPS